MRSDSVGVLEEDAILELGVGAYPYGAFFCGDASKAYASRRVEE
jgi:hypothetical protein